MDGEAPSRLTATSASDDDGTAAEQPRASPFWARWPARLHLLLPYRFLYALVAMGKIEHF
jgi:hypothetical protein